jgi:hypothetical protein
MSKLNLEQRYRRVLRLLPRYYRAAWEEDMVAAFLDSWLTGDRETDQYIIRAARPSWAETASVAGLAIRLYLGGAGAPRRYFAWGQAVRRAVLTVLLLHAALGVNALVLLAWNRHLAGLPTPPLFLREHPPGGVWPVAYYVTNAAWIVVFVTLVLGRYRTARLLAAAAIVPTFVAVLQDQLTGVMPAPFGSLAYWILLSLTPVLAMTAFHRDAPPAERRPWLLALPVGYLLVFVPQLVLRATGNFAWLPDFPGLCCIIVSVACLAHAPRAWFGRDADSGVWSLSLTLLAALAGVYRLVTLVDFLHVYPHLVQVGVGELLILVTVTALIAPNAAHTQASSPAPPLRPHLG